MDKSITKRERSETSYQQTKEESEKSNRALMDSAMHGLGLIENMPAGIIAVDKSSMIVVFNKAAEEITGFSSAELTGKVFSGKHMPQADPLFGLEPLLQVVSEESKPPKETETSVHDKNGKSILLFLRTFQFKDPRTDLTGTAVIFFDITNQREIEKQLQLNHRLSDLGGLASKIAHDLRNPLNIIRMAAELLEGTIGKEQKQDIRIIVDQVILCDQKIKKLLSIVGPVSSTGLTKIYIKEFFEELLKDLDKQKLFSDIDLRKEYGQKLPPVFSSYQQLRQIFENLIRNAVDAMQTGGKLTIRTKCISGVIHIDVVDSGPGIAPEIKERLFEPFFSTREGGIGLGLSVVQKTVFDLKGVVEVESMAGKGTTFTVKLPTEGIKSLVS